MMMAASPATAAPNNKNNEFDVVPLECDAPLFEVVVRPNPGEGSPAWNVETGAHYVAKRFEITDEFTAQIVGGDSVTTIEETVEDFGASAPANGRKDLVPCVGTFAFADGPFEIDDQFAADLNDGFGTDIFAAGQLVTISGSSTFRVLVLVTGG